MTDEEFEKISAIFENTLKKAIEEVTKSLEEDREQRKIYLEKVFLTKVGNNLFSRLKMFTKIRISSTEVAEILNIKVGSVDKKVHRGEIRAHRDANGHYYFFRHELEEDIFSRKKNTAD